MSPTRASLSALLAALVLAGCASSPLPPAPTATAAAAVPAAAPAAAAAPGASADAVRAAQAREAELAAAAAAAAAAASTRAMAVTPPEPMSVYFAFDDYALNSEASPVVDRYGQFLSANPAARVRVEGHCDERGGREYNLALGAKRAQSVVDALRLLGVRDTAMEAISYGKERPRVLGSSEAAWAQNRRADLLLR